MTALLTLAAGAALALPGGATAGWSGAVSAVLGAAVVLLFFWTGAAPVTVLPTGGAAAGLGLLVLLFNYALRLLLVIVALRLASETDTLDRQWLALSVVVCTVVWTTARVAVVLRSKTTL